MEVMKRFWKANIFIFLMYLSASLLQVYAATMLGTATTNLVNKQVSDFVKTIGIVMLLWIVSLVIGYFTGVVQEQTIQKYV